MFANSYDRLAGGRRALLATVCLAVSALACAGTPQAPSERLMVLSEVSVESGAMSTVVSLIGPEQPAYESFLQEDPARIVVDLRSVSPGHVAEALAVYDGVLEEVSITGFEDPTGEPVTRVELGLAASVDYEIEALDDRVQVRVSASAGSGLADAMDEESWTAAGTVAEAEAAPVAPATSLTGVSSDAQGEGTLIHLAADGSIESFEQFVLEDPDRLVIDLPGLQSMTDGIIEIGSSQVSAVRVGQHDDKVRVVVDAAAVGSLADALVGSGTDGLNVALGGVSLPVVAAEVADVPAAMPADDAMVAESDEPMADAEATPGDEAPMDEADAMPESVVAASEPMPGADEAAAMDADEASEMDASGEWAMVSGVSYDAETGRVEITADSEISHQMMRPDAETLVIAIPGSKLTPEAEVRIAPEAPSAISLVSAFEQPEMGEPQVRVVITRATGLEPAVMAEGSRIWLDFPATGDVAAGIPMNAEMEGDEAPSAVEVSDDGVLIVKQTLGPKADAPPAALGEGQAITILREGGLLDGKQYVGRRISLDFKDVDISDVLRLIAEVSDLNVIAGDEVKGEVTIRLVDVPWDQALDVILLTKGLGFVRVGNVLRIAPSEVLKAEDESRLQERRAKEKLEDLLVKLQPVNYADVKEVSKMINRLLTARGTVDVDQRTNTLIIKDIASVIDEATALVKAIDTQTPQVLIESKIVEAALDFSRELGSTWAFGAQPLSDGFDESSGDRRDLGGNDFSLHDNALLSGFTETFNHVSVSNPITSVANGLLDVGAFLLDDKLNLELRIEAAESNGEGKVISSPRIVTLDNRTATIEQGIAIPFQTFENGDAKLEFIDAVLKLEVTPHITADRSIIMKIEVQRNAPDDSVQTPTGSPAIAKNEAYTETLVKDGQTLVIGGIYTVQKAERKSQVPYFGDIPVLGVMFRNSEIRDQRKELLIFVTPRIVQNTQVAS